VLHDHVQSEANAGATNLVEAGDEPPLQVGVVADAQAGSQQQLAALQPRCRVRQLAGVDPTDRAAAAQPRLAGDQLKAERRLSQ
jgi:hypothetical protein